MSAVFFFFFVALSVSWNDCPFGERDCSGICGRFFDSDSDGICDYSQVSPEDREENFLARDTTIDQVILPVSDTAIFSTAETAEIDTLLAPVLKDTFFEDTSKDVLETLDEIPEKKFHFGGKYSFIQITAVLTFLFFLSYLLVKLKILSRSIHLKIWNSVLFLSFSASFILGLLLIIQANSGRRLFAGFDVLYWHVETAIVMAVVSVFHIAWHGSYIRNFFRKK
ncbi:hypothetical protein JW890_02370 [candidate division WOR-3 bacterium]|nr:hypothetical protein [candidate division WOR-3 bacterium]